MLAGVNDAPAQGRLLAALLGPRFVQGEPHPVQPDGVMYDGSSRDTVAAFKAELGKGRASRRRSGSRAGATSPPPAGSWRRPRRRVDAHPRPRDARGLARVGASATLPRGDRGIGPRRRRAARAPARRPDGDGEHPGAPAGDGQPLGGCDAPGRGRRRSPARPRDDRRVGRIDRDAYPPRRPAPPRHRRLRPERRTRHLGRGSHRSAAAGARGRPDGQRVAGCATGRRPRRSTRCSARSSRIPTGARCVRCRFRPVSGSGSSSRSSPSRRSSIRRHAPSSRPSSGCAPRRSSGPTSSPRRRSPGTGPAACRPSRRRCPRPRPRQRSSRRWSTRDCTRPAPRRYSSTSRRARWPSCARTPGTRRTSSPAGRRSPRRRTCRCGTSSARARRSSSSHPRTRSSVSRRSHGCRREARHARRSSPGSRPVR